MAVGEVVLLKLSNCNSKKGCILSPYNKTLYPQFISDVIDTVLLETRAVGSQEALKKMSSADKVKRFQKFFSEKNTRSTYEARAATISDLGIKFNDLKPTLVVDSIVGIETAKTALFVRQLLDAEVKRKQTNPGVRTVPAPKQTGPNKLVDALMPTDLVSSSQSELTPPEFIENKNNSTKYDSTFSIPTPKFPPPPPQIIFPFTLLNSANRLPVVVDASNQDTLNQLNRINQQVDKNQIGFSQEGNQFQLSAMIQSNAAITGYGPLAKVAVELEAELNKIKGILHQSGTALSTEKIELVSPFRNTTGQLQPWPTQFSNADKLLLVALEELADSLSLKLEQVNDSGDFTLTLPSKSRRPKILKFNLSNSDQQVRRATLDILTTEIKQYAQSRGIKVTKSPH